MQPNADRYETENIAVLAIAVVDNIATATAITIAIAHCHNSLTPSRKKA